MTEERLPMEVNIHTCGDVSRLLEDLRPLGLPPRQGLQGLSHGAQYRTEPGYHTSFPPCVGPRGARQQEVLACMRQLDGEAEDDEPKYDGRKETENRYP